MKIRILVAFAAALSLYGCSREVLRRDSPTRIKYPLTPITDLNEALETGPKGRDSEELSRRLKAYQQLREMRAAQGLKHVGASFCWGGKEGGKQCSGQDPGGGGGPGGPGAPGGRDPNGCAWSSIGPTNINGRITGIAIDPASNLRVFVTTVGGIFRSLDGGRRWERVSDDFLATVFSSIAVNGAEIIAGGGDPDYNGGGNGIWRSTSNGDPGTWQKIAGGQFDNQVTYRLRIDAANGDVYAATSGGVYLGTHAGGNLTFAQLDGFDGWTEDLAVDFTATPRLIYAATIPAPGRTFGAGIWKHGLGGATPWVERDNGIPTASIGTIRIALAASATATLYARISSSVDGGQLGIYRTTSAAEVPGAGTAWNAATGAAPVDDSRAASIGGYSWYNNVIEVDPTDPLRVWAAGKRPYRATDGNTFINVGGGAEAAYTYSPHDDQHAIAFDPSNPKIVWLGGDGGLSRSGDTSMSVWRWTDVSHGMVITEYYRLAGQQAMASLRAGGAQDNGTDVTFGNRTWYQPGGCDGATVAIDSSNPDILYGNCNGGLGEFVNPVPGWQGGPAGATWVSPVSPIDPLVTDPAVAHAALAQGQAPVDSATPPNRTGPPILLKTTDGVDWAQANASQPLLTQQNITTIGIAPGSSFQTYYLGVAGGGAASAIWTTSNGGTNWSTGSTGLPNGTPNRIAVDPTNPQRAFAAFSSGGVFMTTNGTDWHALRGTGISAWPAAASAQSVVIDPSDVHTLYVASNIGVFKGTLSGTPADAAWTPYDEGLPDGVNATDIYVNAGAGMLSLTAYGHGAWQRDIRPDVACRAKMVLVRDNVYDRGLGPSPSGQPDPEHPIPDPTNAGFFKPDDTDPGKVYWWSSTDVRIDVPSLDPANNSIAGADSVEAETCPIEMASCPAGTVWDNHPERGQPANAYVQVSNPGLEPVQNVRVIALYADATSGLPDLPSTFWSTTFPAGGGACGALPAGSPWHFVDSAQPCKNLPVVNPQVPETARFSWNVPATQADHTCFLTIAESADDPLDPTIRAGNEVRVWVLVPNNRQIANRNLHVVNVPSAPGGGGGGSGTSGGGVPWPKDLEQPPEVLVSTAGMPQGAKLGVLLPQGGKLDEEGVRPQPAKLSEAEQAEARRLGLDPSVEWVLTGSQVRLRNLPVRRGEQINLGWHWSTGSVPRRSTWRFTVLARSGSRVLGGNVYYLRVR